MSADQTKSRRRILRAATVTLFAGAAVFAAFFALRSGPAKPAEPTRELAQGDLERTDGRLAAADSGETFSGTMVSHYPDGTLRSRSEVVEGRLHGVSEGWYPDGTRETREHFREGVSHGIRERWYPNGQLASRAEIVDGRLHGVFRRWHENGTPAQVIHMREGTAHGLSLGYFPSGYLQARVELNNGDIIRQDFWEDGYMKEYRQ